MRTKQYLLLLTISVILVACQTSDNYSYSESMQVAAFVEDSGEQAHLPQFRDAGKTYVKILSIDRGAVNARARTSGEGSLAVEGRDESLILVSPGPHFILVAAYSSQDRLSGLVRSLYTSKTVLYLQAEAKIHYRVLAEYRLDEMDFNFWIEEAETGRVVTDPVQAALHYW
ncbi:MAG: hypothetical protein KJN90_09155 [Gammaproteobacteria bacterium]|nr:hypothetical protein [Gammaproteobacteria bacterium]